MLSLFRREVPVNHLPSPTHRDEVVCVKVVTAQVRTEFYEVFQFIQVVPGYGGGDAHLQALLGHGILDPLDGGFPATLAAKGIVLGRIHAVQADLDIINPAVRKACGILLVDQGAVGGHGYVEVLLPHVLDDLPEVRPFHGFSAAQGHQGNLKFRDLIHQVQLLIKFEHVRDLFPCVLVAMGAGEVARLCVVPHHKDRGDELLGFDHPQFRHTSNGVDDRAGDKLALVHLFHCIVLGDPGYPVHGVQCGKGEEILRIFSSVEVRLCISIEQTGKRGLTISVFTNQPAQNALKRIMLDQEVS